MEFEKPLLWETDDISVYKITRIDLVVLLWKIALECKILQDYLIWLNVTCWKTSGKRGIRFVLQTSS